MKKFLGLALIAILTLPLFSKEIPLKVTETEWGFEISNINEKGKVICKDNFILNDMGAILLIILKKPTDTFNIDNLIEQESEHKLFKQGDTLRNLILTINGNSFDKANEEQTTNMSDYESVIIVPYFMQITNYKAVCNRNDLNFIVLQINPRQKTKLEELVEQKKLKKNKAENQKKEEKQAQLKELYIKANKEGYDNMPWGTTIDDFKLAYPDAEKIKDEDSFERYEIERTSGAKNYSPFERLNGAKMNYYFYDGKLVMGKTFYYIFDGEQNATIINRLKELYGNPTSAKDLSKKDFWKYNGYLIPYTYTDIRAIWEKSQNFKIESATIGQFADDIPGIDSDIKQLITIPFGNTITYTNEKLVKEIQKKIETQKKAEEESAKRKEMESLYL